MLFDPDSNKLVTDVLFSLKINSDYHSQLTFNGDKVQQCSPQKR